MVTYREIALDDSAPTWVRECARALMRVDVVDALNGLEVLTAAAQQEWARVAREIR